MKGDATRSDPVRSIRGDRRGRRPQSLPYSISPRFTQNTKKGTRGQDFTERILLHYHLQINQLRAPGDDDRLCLLNHDFRPPVEVARLPDTEENRAALKALGEALAANEGGTFTDDC